MGKASITVVVFCLYLQLFHVCLSKNLSNSNGLANGSKNNRNGKGRKKLDPKDLDKPLLDENSLEEDLAERTIVYMNGRKRKPKNINRKPKKSQQAQSLDRHALRPHHAPLPPPSRRKRTYVPEEGVKWPNRVIPYEIQSSTYSNAGTINAVFEEAVSKFNDAGCVTWVPRSSESAYVTVVGNQASCSSYIGYLGVSGQTITLYEYGCVYVDIAIHEMLHAVGSLHEQSRVDDRDKLITYNWGPISSSWEFNYQGFVLSNARQYDLGSVLQYGLWSGSSRVMYANDPDLEYLVTNSKDDLSFYDKAELNAFYRCASDCSNPPTCQNEGFVKQSGGVCSCQCVDGLTGPDCTELDTSPGCGGLLELNTGSSEAISLGPYQTGLMCTWLIKGPEKTKIHLSVDSLDLPTSSSGNCYHFLEIRDYLSGSDGKLVCGNSGGGEFTKMNLGPTNMMVVRFNSDQYSTISPGAGFVLTATAKPSACSSSPCKYPASCEDGATTDEYTCTCTTGYSGVNCDVVAAAATVTDSFEDDFTTLMQHVKEGTDFVWATKKYKYMNSAQRTASDGSLMAAMQNNNFATPFYYASIAKMETSATFERGDRCLRFDYVISDYNVGGFFVTSLTVRVQSATGTTSRVFNTNTGNAWTSVEIDLPAVDDMKIEFECYFGYQDLAMDNIRISPLFCNAEDPCDGVVCQNSGSCEITSSTTFKCECQDGYTGQYCENDVCSGNTCQNGDCVPTSASTYECQCEEGWFGTNCDVSPCQGVECNNGACVALSETQTECSCESGWFGAACNVDPCVGVNCNNGDCEAVSETQTECNCNPGWYGTACDVDPCVGVNCNNGECETLSETLTKCNCNPDWYGTACDVDPCSAVNCNNGVCESLSETETKCNCNQGWYGEFCNVDPCSAVNCNSGVCESLSSTETQCNCNQGWFGEFCNTQDVTHTCDFETNVEPDCFLAESTNDDYDFTRRSGPTPSSRTGPPSAAVGTYYKYTEVSGRPVGSVARLESNVEFSAGTYCLSLSISMYGRHIGTLNILTKEGTGTAVSKAKFTGQQSSSWFTSSTELSLTPSSKIIIETTKGGRRNSQYRGDIAVDNVVLKTGACPN